MEENVGELYVELAFTTITTQVQRCTHMLAEHCFIAIASSFNDQQDISITPPLFMGRL